MATATLLHVQREKFGAQATQAHLLGEIQLQAQLQAELRKLQHTQQALDAKFKGAQAEQKRELAAQELRYARWNFEQQKIRILLQGFHAMGSVMRFISFTSAIVMGFSATLFILQKVDQATTPFKYTYWTLSIITIKLVVQSVFVSSICIVDGTKLCYQGTRGQDDVRRAFHGLMALRSEVFWDFIGGFIAFIVLIVFALWVKLKEHAGGPGAYIPDWQVVYGTVVSVVVWCVPVARMVRTYRSVRRDFRIDYTSYEPGAGTMLEAGDANGRGEAFRWVPSDFELAVGPQSLRRMAERRLAAGSAQDGAVPRRSRAFSGAPGFLDGDPLADATEGAAQEALRLSSGAAGNPFLRAADAERSRSGAPWPSAPASAQGSSGSLPPPRPPPSPCRAHAAAALSRSRSAPAGLGAHAM